MPIVVDASSLLPLALDDEQRSYADAVVTKIATTTGRVPPIFWYEIWNALWVNVTKRQRMTLEAASEFLFEIDQFRLEIEPAKADHLVLGECVDRHITAYDAAYLRLARKLDCPIATLDNPLRAACRQAGIAVFLDTAA